MTAPALHVIPGGLARPLPRYWDGSPIVWGQWTTDASTLAYHLPDDRRACTGCGDVDAPRYVCNGLADQHLVAIRCGSCGHDTIVDAHREVWDLGPEDYGPHGSTLDTAEHYHWDDET